VRSRAIPIEHSENKLPSMAWPVQAPPVEDDAWEARAALIFPSLCRIFAVRGQERGRGRGTGRA